MYVQAVGPRTSRSIFQQVREQLGGDCAVISPLLTVAVRNAQEIDIFPRHSWVTGDIRHGHILTYRDNKTQTSTYIHTKPQTTTSTNGHTSMLPSTYKQLNPTASSLSNRCTYTGPLAHSSYRQQNQEPKCQIRELLAATQASGSVTYGHNFHMSTETLGHRDNGARAKGMGIQKLSIPMPSPQQLPR